MSLVDNYVKYRLPDSVRECCRLNGLLDEVALRSYWKAGGSFEDLEQGSLFVELHLLDLLDRLDRRGGEGSPAMLLELEHVSAKFGMSVRARNVCEAAGLFRLSDIKDFYLQHGTFLKLRNSGKKTALELEDLLRLASLEGLFRSPPRGPLPEHTAMDRDVFQSVFTAEFNRLSTRTRNVLVEMVGSEEVEPVTRLFIRFGKGMPKPRGAGVKVLGELGAMRKALVDRLAAQAMAGLGDSALMSPEEAWAERNGIEHTHLIYLYEAGDGPRLLRLLEFHLRSIAHTRQLRIFLEFLKDVEGKLTLAEVGERLGVTRERVRQILKRMPREMPRQLAAALDLPGSKTRYALLVTEKDVMVIAPSTVTSYNAREGTTWSPQFFAFLAVVLSEDRLAVTSWSEVFHVDKVSRALDKESPLLLTQEVLPRLQAPARRVQEHYERKRTRELRVTLEELLGDPGSANDPVLAEQLLPLLKTRMPDIRILEGVVILPANRRMTQPEMLEQVLISLDEPSHVEQIRQEWGRLFPDMVPGIASIRSVAVRDQERFFSIGRSSTYGLRIWEKERDEIKGGTIRDMIAEWLADKEVPIHISELEAEVLKFRPGTNATSIRLNLELDRANRFIVLKGGFVGLKGRTYVHIPDPPARIAGSLMRSAILSRFVGKHRDQLVAFLVERSGAEEARVERAIGKAVQQGRVHMDGSGYIRKVSSSEGNEEWTDDELPLDW